MYRKIKEKYMPGTVDGRVLPYEITNREIARRAAQEGIVLLKNEDQILPLERGCKIALYGAGASQTIKGGTGSGDVNERDTVSVYQGMQNAGFEITTGEWLKEFDRIYMDSRITWRDKIFSDMEESERAGTPVPFFTAYANNQYHMPEGSLPEMAETDTAIYVISRIAGEGADRFDEAADYYLSEAETNMLDRICALYSKVIILINSGSIIDLGFMEKYQNIKGLLLISQPGMEGGNAVADVLCGAVTPSGKLTDTWALKYENYPNSELFSHNSGDVEKEYYTEGIYVGYRYFDTFRIPVRYPFGFGLSYTDFELMITGIRGFALKREDARIVISGTVKNTGDTYCGKEVIQFYASCPQGKQDKEYRRLIGYYKTRELKPQEEDTFELDIPVYQLASYCEKTQGWVLEQGIYGIFAGNCLPDSVFVGSVNVKEDKLLIRTEQICPLEEELEELHGDMEEADRMRESWLSVVEEYPMVTVCRDDLVTREITYGTEYDKVSREAWDFTERLSVDQLISLATGDPGKDQSNVLGSAGVSIPGSAAQTSECAVKDGIASVVLADGPAGLRLRKEYKVKDGMIQPQPFQESVEGGFFQREEDRPEGESRYQYCTAFPVGTMLAQTWNEALLTEIGRAVANEMDLFEVTFWLAPGMNIHRNPLCGRNFEYYSEDPYLSGRMAAAITNGVQAVYGCGTTIKHFACNNQEDNRMGSDSIVSERALREIYLKGFEIAVKTSQPFSIMTSYNKINGIHTANNYDLCTKVARDEWDFHGVIMTDWTTTSSENCTASGCMRAGNDLVMPGSTEDHRNMREELEKGTLTISKLRKSVANLVNIIWISNQTDTRTGNKAVDHMRTDAFYGDRRRDAGLIKPVGIESIENISYGPYGKENLLDIYRSEVLKGKGPQPVIVNIHGGGWTYGDKELYSFYCMDLAGRGFTVVNFNYRLSPEYQFPAGIEDTNAVVIWMTEHAQEYDLDMDRVFVVGDSAGAQMNSQYMALLSNAEYRKLFDFEVPYDKVHVRATALNCGIYDMKSIVLKGEEELFQTYLGKDLKQNKEMTLERIDVYKYLSADFPASYVMTASHDFLKECAEPMAARLASLGVTVECHEYGTEEQEYMQHVFHCNLRMKEAILCNDDECDFFRSYLTE